jgi:hypothetical protein
MAGSIGGAAPPPIIAGFIGGAAPIIAGFIGSCPEGKEGFPLGAAITACFDLVLVKKSK